jgi:protein-S-isoprenylcysteine O-methyltransferase Ste14
MMIAGLGLALGSWMSAALVTVAAMALYGYRVKVEEKALLATIGEPYRTYMKDRKRFIPYIV